MKKPIMTAIVRVAGVTMGPGRQERLQKIFNVAAQGWPLYKFTVRLIHEKDNPHDADAVRVDVYQPSTKTWVDIGYLPRSCAQAAAPALDRDLIDDVRLNAVDFFMDNGEKIYFCTVKIQPKRG